jgi:hypothetical protein
MLLLSIFNALGFPDSGLIFSMLTVKPFEIVGPRKKQKSRIKSSKEIQ